MKTCPEVALLPHLLSGQLSDTEFATLETHLQGCECCQRELDRLNAEGKIATWQQGHEQGDAVQLAADLEMFRHVKDTILPEHVSAPDRMEFGPPTARGPLGQLVSYHLIKQLGSGGFGVVYQAYDETLDQVVAIKVLLPERALSSEHRARFEREAKKAAAVKHENVVTIHQVGQNPIPYMVMEFIEGEPLSVCLERQGTLPPREAARLVREVALGLAVAHQHGQVHRDIKPANIMLQTVSSNRLPGTTPATDLLPAASVRAKITDFGLARKLETTDTRLTQSGAIVGTPAYMSPEQITAPDDIDARSDLYSLGVVLYELLTGGTPFRGVTYLDIFQQTIHDEPYPPRKFNETLPRDLETITLKCLAKEPAKRYATAQALADDLSRFLAHETIQARPSSTAEKAIKWARRRPMVAGLVAAVLLVSAVGSAAFAWAFSQTIQARDLAVDEKNNTAVALGEAEKARNQAVAESKRAEESLVKEKKAREEVEEQREQAESSVVKMKFRHDLFQARSAPISSILNTAKLLDERILLTNQPLRESLRLHLDDWIGRVHQLRCLLSHEEAITAIAFSPDGKMVATGSTDGVAQLWNTATGSSIGRALKHENIKPQLRRVDALAFSPDGKILATVGFDGTARLWDSSTSKQIHTLLSRNLVVFSPNGSIVATNGINHVQLWNVVTGKKIGGPLLHQAEVDFVAFSPDGKTVATGSRDNNARLWNVATATLVGEPLAHRGRGAVRFIMFSPDSKNLATYAEKDNKGRLWATETGTKIADLPHEGDVHAVAFSPDGKIVATAGGDKMARLWEATTGKQIAELKHNGDARSVAFSPDGKTVATTSDNSDAKIWYAALWTATGEAFGEVMWHKGKIVDMVFSKDGKTLATAGDKTVRLMDVATGTPLGTPMEHQSKVRKVIFNPDNETLGTMSVQDYSFRVPVTEDRSARLWQMAKRQPIGEPLEHQNHKITAAVFSPDGKTIATASNDKTAQLWSTATGKPIGKSFPHQAEVHAVAFSPDGKSLATACNGKEPWISDARLWDIETSQQIGGIWKDEPGSRLLFSRVVFSPDGKKLVT